MLAIFFVYVKRLLYFYSNAAIAEVFKIDGDQACENKDFSEAVRLYKEALDVQCKDDSLNTELKKGEQKTSRENKQLRYRYSNYTTTRTGNTSYSYC